MSKPALWGFCGARCDAGIIWHSYLSSFQVHDKYSAKCLHFNIGLLLMKCKVLVHAWRGCIITACS